MLINGYWVTPNMGKMFWFDTEQYGDCREQPTEPHENVRHKHMCQHMIYIKPWRTTH
jgi:hypothetical protein